MSFAGCWKILKNRSFFCIGVQLILFRPTIQFTPELKIITMKDSKYICKKQLLEEFEISKSTFYRLIKRLGIPISGQLLSPREAEDLRGLLRQKAGQGPGGSTGELD